MKQEKELIKKKFRELSTVKEFAELIQCNQLELHYYLYKADNKEKYTVVTIKQKNGKERKISIPCLFLASAQQKLYELLYSFYKIPENVHGFIRGRSIATNAQQHEGQTCVLNIDLKDFFGSINFGRIRGLFLAAPYNFSKEAATFLAQICCFDNELPQGSPISPLLSNMICAHMDFLLAEFARRNKCIYTRYADDITISCKTLNFNKSVVEIVDGKVELGRKLREIIEKPKNLKSSFKNFEINENKIYLRGKGERLEVTGLIVNRRVNVSRRFINQIRAMLYAWEKHGLEKAGHHFWLQYDRKNRFSNTEKSEKAKVVFNKVVKGKLDFLAMVRGNDDPIYRKFIQQYWDLNPSKVIPKTLKHNHLKRPEDFIFVIENFQVGTQGTAFYLENFGFVTCAHVLPKEAFINDFKIFHYKNPELEFKISDVMVSEELDLAYFKVPELTPQKGGLRGIKKNTPALVNDHSQIEIKGFPKHTSTSTITISPGDVLSAYNRESKGGLQQKNLRYSTNADIREGISGGPVFNQNGLVVGVAAVSAKAGGVANEFVALENIYETGLFELRKF